MAPGGDQGAGDRRGTGGGSGAPAGRPAVRLERHERLARLRTRTVALCADYGARVEIVAVEAAPPVMRARNRARAQPVPDAAIHRMIGRWETPDPTEAHTVTWIDTGAM